MTGFEGQQRHLTGFWNGFLTKNAVFRTKLLQNQKTCINFALANKPNGAIAQLVEQRTENPCVPGSIPGGTTARESCSNAALLLFTPDARHRMT